MRKPTAKTQPVEAKTIDLNRLRRGPFFNDAANVYVAERKAMLTAATEGNLALIKQLLQEHKLTDFEETEIINIGNPPKHYKSAQILCNAVQAGQMEVIRYLVDIVGADLNATDAGDDSPIDHAAMMGENDILNFLIAGREGISEDTLIQALECAIDNTQETTTTTLIKKLNKGIEYVKEKIAYYRDERHELAIAEMFSRIAAKMKREQQQTVSVATFLALTASMDTIQESQTLLLITALAAMSHGTTTDTTVTLDSTHSSQSNGSSSSTSAPSQAGPSLSAFASFTTTDHKRKKSKRKLIAGDTTSDPVAKKTSSSALFIMPKAPDEKTNVSLSKVYATLDQAYPESMVEHMRERTAYLRQLSHYSTYQKVLTSADKTSLAKILTTLKSVISQRTTSGKTMT